MSALFDTSAQSRKAGGPPAMSALPSPEFGSMLRRYRLAARLTQEELAELSGVSPRAVIALERGERRRPYRHTLALLVSALQLSAWDTETLQRAAGYLPVDRSHEGCDGAARANPLVGRSRELAALERYFENPAPPVLVFAGEPGIGKSRLLQEAARMAPTRGYTVLQGGGQRRSGQEPYAPLLEPLSHSLIGLSRSRLHDALTGCGWLTRLLPELLDIVNAPLPIGSLPPEQERRLVFSAVARYLRNRANGAGILLLLDDLQWSSPDGLDLLGSLFQVADVNPIRMIGAYRDSEVLSDHPLNELLAHLAEQHLADQLTLNPLGDQDAMSLLDNLAQSSEQTWDDQVKERIVQRAGGVPFFLVSCTHGLDVNRGSDIVPWSVAQSIRQRMVTLPQIAQEILCAAAVLGRVMERSVICQMIGSPENQVLKGLDLAGQAHLLLPHGKSTYRFAHDVVRESIDADLGEAQRMLLHKRAGEVLEAGWEWNRDGARRAAELAWHFSEGDEPERALAYAIQAGDEDAAIGAHIEGKQHFQTALELARRANNHEPSAKMLEAAILEKLSALLAVSPSADEVLESLQQAVSIYHELGDRENEGRVIAQIGRAYYWGVGTTPERRREGIAYLQAARRSLEDASDQTRAALTAVLTHLLSSFEMYPQTLEAARTASDLARASGHDGI
ncbi:MAG TPA: AAA family ATPase, partial [Chloroflexota bacterium]